MKGDAAHKISIMQATITEIMLLRVIAERNP